MSVQGVAGFPWPLRWRQRWCGFALDARLRGHDEGSGRWRLLRVGWPLRWPATVVRVRSGCPPSRA